jgi:hypothetical protein
MTGVGDLVQRTRDDRTGRVLSGRVIERSGDALCSLHRARGNEKHMFFGSASKPRSTVCGWFCLKTTRTVFSGLVSKPVARVFWFGPQNWQLQFSDLSIKITTTIYWFSPQNQAGFSLSVAPQNQWRDDGVGHALRSDGLLHLELSSARVFQSGLKTGGGTTVCGACVTIVEVASESS